MVERLGLGAGTVSPGTGLRSSRLNLLKLGWMKNNRTLAGRARTDNKPFLPQIANPLKNQLLIQQADDTATRNKNDGYLYPNADVKRGAAGTRQCNWPSKSYKEHTTEALFVQLKKGLKKSVGCYFRPHILQSGLKLSNLNIFLL